MATKETNYAGVTSGADVNIVATMIARGWQIEEAADGAAAGLQISWPDGTVCQYVVGDEPLSAGNITGFGGGPIVGVPLGATQPATPMPGGVTAPASPATIYCKVRSLGATTKVRCVEFS